MKKNRFSKFTLLTIAFFAVACSTGHCRRDGSGQVLQKVDPKPPTGYQQENLGDITIGKADGSLQCGMSDGLSLEQMAAEQLPGIEILAAEKQNDGMMRIQSCGAQTGMMNTYKIRHQDLRKAQQAGFTVIKSKK